MRVPGTSGFDDGVEDDEELSHAGGEDDFEGFAMLSESIGESFDDGVEAFGSQGSHVEDGAHGLTSAANGTLSLLGAAVTIEGSQAHERGDLLPVEFAEFGNIGDHGGRGDGTQARNGLDELSFVSPVIVGLNEGLDGAFDVVDLPLEGVQHGLDAFLSGLGTGHVPAIGLLRSQVDELSSASDELLDFGLFFGSFFDRGGPDPFREESQDPGIDAVGLGHQAQSFREVSCPPRIDDRDTIAGIGEVSDDLSLVAASGFEDDETMVGSGEQLAELPMSRN